MRQFVVKRGRRDKGLRSVEVFGAEQHMKAAVAAELAEIEGLEAKVFFGAA